jgi:hypothetical protein
MIEVKMKIALKYGFGIAVLIAIVNSICIDLIGIENKIVFNYSGYVPFIFLAIGLYLAMRLIKQEVYHNEWKYGQAIYNGIVTSAFAALFLGIFYYLYFQYLHPGHAEEMIRITMPLMEKDNLSQEEISQQISVIKSTYLPINQLTGTSPRSRRMSSLGRSRTTW